MRKRIFLFLLIIVLFFYITQVSFANEWITKEILKSKSQIKELSDNMGYLDLPGQFDFWHHSGGYWQTNISGKNIIIYDAEMKDSLDNKEQNIKLGEKTGKIAIPANLKKYLDNGGLLDDINFTLESKHFETRYKAEKIYVNKSIQMKLVGNYIHIKHTPIFNIDPFNPIRLKTGELNISVPKINSKFGFPLFAIWNKDGTPSASKNIGNIGDLPEGQVFLAGEDSQLSIDTSSDIINPQGDLVKKDIGIWNVVKNTYNIIKKDAEDCRIGNGTFSNGGAVGMKFIFPLRMYYPVASDETTVVEDIEEEVKEDIEIEENIATELAKEYSEVFEGDGVIKAMSPNSSEYDVLLGIPSSEEVYTQVIGKSRVTNYAFEKVTGNKDFIVTVKRKYREKWKVVDEENSTEDETVYINKSRSETVSKNYIVNRDYSYYTINYFENYGIDSATVASDVLPGGEVTLIPNNYTQPTVDLTDEINIVSEPSVNSVVNLSDKTVGKNETPSSPNWSDTAENAVGNYQVRNDSLIFDSDVIMDSSTYAINAPAPNDISEAALIHEDVLRKGNLKISDTKRNGTYASTGEILYKKTFDYNGTSSMTIVDDISVNSVKVHTPIYSELLISSVGDDYNQQINGNINDRAIILGMPTKFRYQTTGNHRNILGYGNRDYDKYIGEKEIKFPFDLYYNATSRDNSKFVKKNTWITVNALDTDIYVPIWVDEGSYTVQIRSKAINSLDQDVSSSLVNNTDNNYYYIVEDEKTVEVIGRLYGFKVRDINDYPIWEEVFRKDPNSYEFIEGNNYPFGGKDENGKILRSNDKFFLPIAPGSHPTFSNAGSIPLGYKIRFTVETIGNYLKDDQVLIKPSFSFLDYDGNKKEDIKVWSKVRLKNKDYLIDLSSIDSTLKDQIAYTIDLGNPYITLKEESFIDTSDFLGISLFDLKKKVERIGFADEISLTKYLRSYIGDISNVPDSINESQIKQSRQKWYGEYWLPNNTYVLKDDIDLIAYAAENNGIDFNEDIFMKDGYLKVNFNIETAKDENSVGENLAYRNVQSNMYQIEGFNNEKEIMINGMNKTLSFDDGDVIFYDVNRKRSDDYDSFGTH